MAAHCSGCVFTIVMRGWAKTSPEYAASNILPTHQPPAPIFLSDLDNHTRSSQSGFMRSWKTCKSLRKINKPRKFWKSFVSQFSVELGLIRSWISVRDCAYIPAVFNFKIREITAKHLFNINVFNIYINSIYINFITGVMVYNYIMHVWLRQL